MQDKQLLNVCVISLGLFGMLGVSAPGVAQTLEGERVEGEEQPVKRRFSTNFDQRHDRGGYLRVSVGGGWASDRVRVHVGETVTTSGLGMFPSVVAGWLPWTQTAVHVGSWGLIGGDLVHLGAGLGATHYFSATGNFWVGGQVGPVTRGWSGQMFREWGLGAEAEIGLGGWTGDRWSVGGSLFGGGAGVNLDGNDRAFGAWQVGLRLHVVYN